MKLTEQNYELELNEDIEQLKLQKEELEKLRKILGEFPEQYLLYGKTQMIGKGNIKNVRSRKEHSENIKDISRKIIEGIYEKVVPEEIKQTEMYKLNKQIAFLYSDIVSLGHDIGHSPYGHLGERILNSNVRKYKFKPSEISKIMEKREKIFGEKYERAQGHLKDYKGKISFEHNEKSAELMYYLAKENDIDLELVNIQRIVDGILAHSTSRVNENLIPNYLEAQVVRQVDKIEYMNSDYEEVKEFINSDKMEKEAKQLTQKEFDERVKELINMIINGAIKEGKIYDTMDGLEIIKKFIKSYIGVVSVVDVDGKTGLVIDENVERITLMMEKVIQYYLEHPEEIQEITLRKIHPIMEKEENNLIKITLEKDKYNEDSSIMEKVITYICRMDDAQLKQRYMSLVRERIIKGEGYGIEPITQEEMQKIKEKQLKTQANKLKYKDIEEGEAEHSDDEYKQMVIEENQEYINQKLADIGRKQMIQNRKKHREEFLIDKKLNEMKEEFDEIRLSKKQLSISEKSEIRNQIKDLMFSDGR